MKVSKETSAWQMFLGDIILTIYWYVPRLTSHFDIEDFQVL